MLTRLFSIHRQQRGFTLVELLVAVAITGFIVAALTLSISQIFSVGIADKNRMEAVKQVENALHYINRDVQQSKASELASTTLTPFTTALNLKWVDYTATPTENIQVEYWLEGTDLQRTYTIGNTSAVNIVASHVVSAESNYSFDGAILTVNLTADVGGYQPAPESRTLQVKPRIN